MEIDKTPTNQYNIKINKGTDFILTIYSNKDNIDFSKYDYFGILVNQITGEKVSMKVKERDNTLQKVVFTILKDYTRELRRDGDYVYQIIEQYEDGTLKPVLWGYAKVYDTVLI